MCKLKPHRGSFSSLLSVCLLCFVYFLWVAPSAAESFSLAKADLTGSQNFTVSTNDGFVALEKYLGHRILPTNARTARPFPAVPA